MPIKVLLVDDDDAYRSVTAIALESEGCLVQEAADGYAALEALQFALPNVPDVIVSDLYAGFGWGHVVPTRAR